MRDAEEGPVPPRKKSPALLAVLFLALAAAGALWATFPGPEKPSTDPDKEDAATLDLRADSFGAQQRIHFDDSGYMAAHQYVLPVQNPHSFEHIRECFHRIGYRGIALLENELAIPGQDLEDATNKQFQLALLHLYEGEAKKAGEVLARLRRTALANPERL